MRKITREAVIFMLLGIVLCAAFIALDSYRYYHNISWTLWTHMTLFEKFFEVVKGSAGTGFMYGAVIGLCVWTFYRVLRFAVKG
jgi:hypothetical protein